MKRLGCHSAHANEKTIWPHLVIPLHGVTGAFVAAINVNPTIYPAVIGTADYPVRERSGNCEITVKAE